jgi:cytochrome c oxidase subunit 3
MYVIDEKGDIRQSSGRLMVRLLLVEVVILFAALLVVIAALPSANTPTIPSGIQHLFILSTTVIVLSSLLLVWLVRRPQSRSTLLTWITISLGLALFFIMLQVIGFWQLYNYILENPLVTSTSLKVFYVVIGLHALHLLGGLVLKIKLLVSLLTTSSLASITQSLRLLEPYWHLLTIIWLVFYALL